MQENWLIYFISSFGKITSPSKTNKQRTNKHIKHIKNLTQYRVQRPTLEIRKYYKIKNIYNFKNNNKHWLLALTGSGVVVTVEAHPRNTKNMVPTSSANTARQNFQVFSSFTDVTFWFSSFPNLASATFCETYIKYPSIFFVTVSRSSIYKKK